MATFRIPTLAEIISGARDAIIGLIPDAGLGSGEDYDNEAAIMGGMVWQLFRPIAYVEDQIFPDTAAPTNLARHAELNGVVRKGAAPARGFLLILGQAGANQGIATSATSPSGVAVATDAAVTVATPTWVPKIVASYDPTRTNTVVLVDTFGMFISDSFDLGGSTYCIKDLPGGGSVIIYGRFVVDPKALDTLKPVPGARTPITAVVAGSAGNLPFATPLQITGPGANVNPVATVLELSGGDDEEDPARWALRIQEVRAERNGGGNRSQVLTWTLEVPGIDQAFVYDLFRGLGTGDVVPQGVKGARHLSGAKLAEAQDYVRPFVPTDANPGKVTMGGHDVLITDFTDRPVDLDLILTGGPGYGPDWQGTMRAAPGCTTTRINTLISPLGVVSAEDRVTFPVGIKLLEVGLVQSVDANGFNLVAPLTVAPGTGLFLYPGSSLTEPVRDALLALFDVLGPGDTVPPSRYPAPTTYAPAQLSLNLIHATVRKVRGLLNCQIVLPTSDITPNPKAQCVAQSLILRFA